MARKPGVRRRRRYFVYLLRCGDRTFYAGYTTDPARRLAAHRRGRASRYTRGRGPWSLAAVWQCPTLGAALRLERMLKAATHAGKRRLAGGAPLSRILRRVGPGSARRVAALRVAAGMFTAPATGRSRA